MSATTVNSFPSLNNWNSPRAWALAIIVLLHLGFFYALTHGMSINPLKFTNPLPPEFIPLLEKPTPVKQVQLPEPVIKEQKPEVTYVEPEIAVEPEITGTGPIVKEMPKIGDEIGPGSVMEPLPQVIEPRIDSRRGLTEPYYPADIIRKGGEGTVLLSIYILADGRVGEVRLVSSSGHSKLDDSAMREAKKWRFIPGTSDGKPMAMWKQVPVTFRLNTRM
ncbi:MAG TPA: energy transducer TonB [Steroidobacter sp.]